MAGENNNLNVRSYSLEFKELLQAVFEKRAIFTDFFVGGIEALDGVQHNAKAFTIKTSDIPVAVSSGYITTADVAFGTGTSKSSRFGNRTEIIYTDTDAEYTWGWLFHEGIDRYTVNQDLSVAVADRLELQAQAKVAEFNKHHAAFISASAGKNLTDYPSIDKDNVVAVFNQLHKYFVNIGAVGTKVAKVTPDIYSAIVDTGLMTSAKGGTVSMDNNTVNMFKGFQIEEMADGDFADDDEVIYAYVTGVGKAFTGIETARTIESEDFDGVALQGAGKAGEFILPANKAAVVKVTLTPEA